MLASKYLLRGTKDIERVKSKGLLFQSQNFGALVLAQEKESDTRFAFIISKNISRLAVQRNRIKRALSEAVRINRNIVREGLDIVFLAKLSITSVPTDKIMEEVSNFFRQQKFKK